MPLRDREFQSYYQPWLAAHGSSFAVARHLDSLAATDLQKKGWEALPSRDRTLIAFAQNVVFRLNVRRAMVSLIDKSDQYIIAEATRSHSSTYPNGKPGDEIWLGSAILARPDAMCENCLGSMCHAIEEDGSQYTTEGLIINDAREDARFKEKSYVLQEEGARVRFYAGVPLISRSGCKIGVLAVSDENTRDGLSAEELRYMADMAQCAMDHLEWARDRVDRFKGERVVRGMADFIDGSSMSRNVSKRRSHDAMQSHTRPPSPSTDPGSNNNVETSVNVETTTDKSSRMSETASTRGPTNIDGVSPIYTSAAEVLRDCTLSEGCMIFGTIAGLPRKSIVQPAADLSPDSVSRKLGGNASDQKSDGVSARRTCKLLAFSAAHHLEHATVESGPSLGIDTLERYFSLFPQGRTLYFTEEGIGISPGDDETSARKPGEEQSGKRPSFWASSRLDGRSRSSRMDHQEILRIIPGAQTIAFVPLYDHTEAKLIAGIFLWTSKIGRMAIDSDLSHLRAFASCIVSEIARADIQKNEAAKTTFIASISHELRSPLHGILGASEFLMETTSSAYEAQLVMSIITCGKTLLDTLNHVLDYSKINKLGSTLDAQSKKKLVNFAADAPLESLNLTADVDLSRLVEEAAESVTAGHTFRRLPHPDITTNANGGSLDSLTAQVEDGKDREDSKSQEDGRGQQDDKDRAAHGVAVLVDISPRDSWMVTVQPGALQRVIMNLMGNAFKYTTAGFVGLSLRALESSDEDMIHVLLRVVDSGQGIGTKFQQNHLFVPFSQEDSFQPGTGLGLSIVKQIVDSLQGSIEVRSEPGSGTEIDVRLRLPAAQETSPETDLDNGDDHKVRDQTFAVHLNPHAILDRTKRKHLVLLDPLDTDKTRPPTDQASRFQETLRQTCEQWFGMRVSRSSEMHQDEDVAIYMYGEPPPFEILKKHSKANRSRHVPIIIACQNNRDALAVVRDHQKYLCDLGEIVEVVQQPCGPRKLAKALMICLDRAEENGHISEDIASPDEQQSSPGATDDSARKQEAGLFRRTSSQMAAQQLRKSVNTALSRPEKPPLDPEVPLLKSDESGDTSMDFYKPRSSPDTHDESDTKGPGASQEDDNTKSLHILIVDDNKINRQLLVMFANKNSYTYEEAENGQEAVDKFHASCSRNEPFDYIFMDISMPVMDGMEATRLIRRQEQSRGGRKTKIFALTGVVSEKAREEAEVVGVDLFLAKPVKFKELKGLLEK